MEKEKIHPLILDIIREWVETKRTGKLVLNFLDGRIPKVTKQETEHIPK